MKAFDYIMLKRCKDEGYNFVCVDYNDEAYVFDCMPYFDELRGHWRRSSGMMCSLGEWLKHSLDSGEVYVIDDLLERVKTSLKTKEGRVYFFADVFESFYEAIKDEVEHVYFDISLLNDGTLSLYDEHKIYHYNKKRGVY